MPKYHNVWIFQDVGDAILDFFKFQIRNEPNGHEGRTASLCQISSKSLKPRPMAIFRFFQDGGRPPSWICNECVGTTHEGHLVVVSLSSPGGGT